MSGAVVRFDEESVLIEAGGLAYAITLAPCIYEPLRAAAPTHATLEVYATLSIDGNSARAQYFGFNNTVERAFFEALLSVASIGPKTAARAFSRPMAEIARAIDAGDEKGLVALPGIGRQKAREIIAKLQGRVARFLLIPEGETAAAPAAAAGFVAEALEVLVQLGYREAEAMALIERERGRDGDVADVETLLRRIYGGGREAA